MKLGRYCGQMLHANWTFQQNVESSEFPVSPTNHCAEAFLLTSNREGEWPSSDVTVSSVQPPNKNTHKTDKASPPL